jgi:hypothetical protein
MEMTITKITAIALCAISVVACIAVLVKVVFYGAGVWSLIGIIVFTVLLIEYLDVNWK